MAPKFPKADVGMRLSDNDLGPASLASRQVVSSAGTECDTSGMIVLSQGGLAGVVIGTIAGTLLLLWLIRSCTALGPPMGGRATAYHEEPVTTRHRRSSRHSHHRHHDHHGGYTRRESIGVVPVMVQKEGVRASRSPRRPSGTYVVGDEGRGRAYYPSR